MDYLTDIYLVTTKIAKPSVFQAKFIISVKWKCRGFLYYLQYLQTRSLGALRATTSSLGPFGPGLRPSRPSGAQAARPTQVT